MTISHEHISEAWRRNPGAVKRLAKWLGIDTQHSIGTLIRREVMERLNDPRQGARNAKTMEH